MAGQIAFPCELEVEQCEMPKAKKPEVNSAVSLRLRGLDRQPPQPGAVSQSMRRARRALAGILLALAGGCGIDPGEETARLRGDGAFARGEYEEALAEYRLSLLRENPGADGMVRVAHAYAALGRVDDARSLYERAVREDAVHAGQAVADFIAVAKRAHANGDAYGLASAVEAASAFQPGLVVEDLALPLARHYTAAGEPVRALPLYLMVLGATRDDPDLVLETARAHHEIGDCERALSLFEEFGDLAPRRARETRWHVGSCSFQLAGERIADDRLEEALGHLDRLLRLQEPKTLVPRTHHQRAQLLERLGECGAAVEAYRRVVQASASGSGPLVESARARIDEIRFGGRDGAEGTC